MDSGACKNLCGVSSLKKQQKEGIVMNTMESNKDVSSKLPDLAAESNGSLVPITPIVVRENGDFRVDLKSPLTVMKKPFNLSEIDSACKENGSKVPATAASVVVDDSSPKTPKDDVFDPFAPGPEILARAPMSKKYCSDDLRSSVARQIKFNRYSDDDDDVRAESSPSGSDEYDSLSDQEMFECVYEDLLEVIASTQGDSLLAALPDVEYDSDDCKTPSTVLFNGIAETCPGAPMKPAYKGRVIPVGLRRKLEF